MQSSEVSRPAGTEAGRWSVSGVGLILVAAYVVAAVADRQSAEFDALAYVLPVAVGVAVTAYGAWLARGEHETAAIRRVAWWTLGGAVALLPFGVWQVDVVDALGPSIQKASLVVTFVAIGALTGAIAGLYDVRQRADAREAERAYAVLRNTHDGVATIDENGDYELVNPSFARSRGFDDPSALVGRPFEESYSDAEYAYIEAEVLPAIETDGKWEGELSVRRSDGTPMTHEITATALPSGGIAVISRDVTARREQERRLRTIVENAPVAIFEYDATGTFTMVEGTVAEELGLTGDAILGTNVRDLFPKGSEVAESVERALEGEFVEATIDLQGRHFKSWADPVVEDGEVTRVVGTVVDITEQVEYEESLAALHDAGHALTLASTPEEVAETTVDIAGRVLDSPLSAVWLYDESRDVLEPGALSAAGREMFEAAGVDGLPTLAGETHSMSIFRGGELEVVEDYGALDDPSIEGLELGTVVLAPLGDYGLLELGKREVEEVSEADRHQAEILAAGARTALESADSEERLRRRQSAVEALHDATRRMMAAEDDFRICEIAVETARDTLDLPMTGMWLADEDGDALLPVEATEEKRALLDELPTYAANDSVYDEAFELGETYAYQGTDDDRRPAEAAPGIVSEIVAPVGRYGVLKTGAVTPNAFDEADVALVTLLAANTAAALERADRETTLERRTDQMEFFNSILRHDVLNGMTVIRARAEMLAEELEGTQGQYAETIVAWCDDVTDIVSRVRSVLQTLTSEEEPDLEATDLSTTLEREIDRVATTYDDVEFRRDVEDGLVVRADELLAEVLGNVLTNAVEHNEREGLVVASSAERDGDEVEVRIADNGTGVSDDRKEAVFRRGETGHAKQTGSGFGLFFVDAMVDAYGGEIWIEDAEGGGAVFVVRLSVSAVGL